MNYKCPLIVVENLEKARGFYEGLLNQKVILDFGANITFEGDFSLQTKESWEGFIGKDKEIAFRTNNFELYFEETKFTEFVERLKSCTDYEIELLHDVVEYPWGQHVIRLYDPDRHIIEVGESMAAVVLRFRKQGMSPEEIADKTQHPIKFVNEVLKAQEEQSCGPER